MKCKCHMRLEEPSQPSFCSTPFSLPCTCYSPFGTERCQRRWRQDEGAVRGPQNLSHWTDTFRCRAGSCQSSTVSGSSAPHMKCSKLAAQKLKIKSNKSCSEELQLLIAHSTLFTTRNTSFQQGKLLKHTRNNRSSMQRSGQLHFHYYCCVLSFKSVFNTCNYTGQLTEVFCRNPKTTPILFNFYLYLLKKEVY